MYLKDKERMNMIKSPYISHVEIENFRNFENVDVD